MPPRRPSTRSQEFHGIPGITVTPPTDISTSATSPPRHTRSSDKPKATRPRRTHTSSSHSDSIATAAETEGSPSTSPRQPITIRIRPTIGTLAPRPVEQDEKRVSPPPPTSHPNPPSPTLTEILSLNPTPTSSPPHRTSQLPTLSTPQPPTPTPTHLTVPHRKSRTPHQSPTRTPDRFRDIDYEEYNSEGEVVQQFTRREEWTPPPGLNDFLNQVQRERGLPSIRGGQVGFWDPPTQSPRGNLHTLRVRRSSRRRESVGGPLGDEVGGYEGGSSSMVVGDPMDEGGEEVHDPGGGGDDDDSYQGESMQEDSE
ncbi:hypothetical protein HDV00_000174 [Rhizophlyctis rosea]|nr:hypothetical protein HDV00_000174 [Rhizophlyctis rosea]